MLKMKFRHNSGSWVCISTLVVQLVALFQIIHAVHAGKWFHAGILPAEFQGTLDLLGDVRVLGHGGERQHVLHLQLASLSTSMSVEVRAALVVTNPASGLRMMSIDGSFHTSIRSRLQSSPTSW
jgi:hypothetical protein